METNTNNIIATKIPGSAITKALHIAFLLLGIFYLAKKDFSNAAVYWGIGLAFDPFDQKQPFTKRPFWQQAWLIIHLAIVFALFILVLWK